MKNFNDDYYAGFDIGTDSVGYAVADTDYNLCKFHQTFPLPQITFLYLQ